MGRHGFLLRQAFPLWGKVARNAPDEGEMCGNRKFSPHQSPAVTASPQGEAIHVVYPLYCYNRKVAGGVTPPPPGKWAAIANFPLISHLR